MDLGDKCVTTYVEHPNDRVKSKSQRTGDGHEDYYAGRAYGISRLCVEMMLTS